MLQEHVIDQVGEMMYNPRRINSDGLVQKVQAQDFDHYISQIKGVRDIIYYLV